MGPTLDDRIDKLEEALNHAFGDEHTDDLHQLVAMEVLIARVQAIRDAFLLEVIGLGYPQRDIAAALNISQGAMSQRLKTVRQREKRRRQEARDQADGGGS